jgi:putative flippase GtrA
MSLRRLLKFSLVYVSQYIASALLLWLLVVQIDMNQAIAPLIVTAVLLPLTFLLSRFVLSRPTGGSGK